jgi:MoxR-like ATPase
MVVDIRELNERIQRESAFVDVLTSEMDKVIVGQKHMVERLLIGLLSNGHILLEGVPGLAKTLAINTLATCIDAKFSRIQFTPRFVTSRFDWYHDLQSKARTILNS